jgi:predicted N-acetyltransferase YhbS
MFNIKIENKKDYSDVYAVIKLAFGREDEAILANKLRASVRFIPELSLVAYCNNIIIGHIMFTPLIFDESPTHKSLALAPLSVHPEYQKRGVGSLLVNRGIDYARELGYDSIFVLGHKEYYCKLGFEDTLKWGIKSPFGDSTQDYFKAIELKNGALSNISGSPIYPNELLN